MDIFDFKFMQETIPLLSQVLPIFGSGQISGHDKNILLADTTVVDIGIKDSQVCVLPHKPLRYRDSTTCVASIS